VHGPLTFFAGIDSFPQQNESIHPPPILLPRQPEAGEEVGSSIHLFWRNQKNGAKLRCSLSKTLAIAGNMSDRMLARAYFRRGQKQTLAKAYCFCLAVFASTPAARPYAKGSQNHSLDKAGSHTFRPVKHSGYDQLIFRPSKSVAPDKPSIRVTACSASAPPAGRSVRSPYASFRSLTLTRPGQPARASAADRARCTSTPCCPTARF